MTDVVSAVDVAVLGAGPAGLTLAQRLARWGIDVAVFASPARRRHHVGESLPAASRSILEALGVDVERDPSVDCRVDPHQVVWGESEPTHVPASADAGSLMVWRGPFDEALQRQAELAGARFEYGTVVDVDVGLDGEIGGGRLRWQGRERLREVRTRLVADCTGRVGILGRRVRDRLHDVATVAITAHWRVGSPSASGADSRSTLVEAIPCGWIWSAPVGGNEGVRDITVFVEPWHGESVGHAYHRSLSVSEYANRWLDHAECLDSPRAADSSPYGATRFAGPSHVLVGDAGSFLDPLSAHGVTKAMDSAAMAGAVVRTLLERASSSRLAIDFYDQRQKDIVRATHRRAGQFYFAESRFADEPFWRHRRFAAPAVEPLPPRAPLRLEMNLVPAAGVAVRVGPALVDDLIERVSLIEGPASRFERPIRFWGGIALPEVFEAAARLDSVERAARHVALPFESAWRAIEWLYLQGYLEERPANQAARPVTDRG